MFTYVTNTKGVFNTNTNQHKYSYHDILVKENNFKMLVHTHNIYQDQTIVLLIGGNDGGIFFYATTIISTTTGGICAGISIDFYSDIGGIDQLYSPVSYVCMCLYTQLCMCYVPNTD